MGPTYLRSKSISKLFIKKKLYAKLYVIVITIAMYKIYNCICNYNCNVQNIQLYTIVIVTAVYSCRYNYNVQLYIIIYK